MTYLFFRQKFRKNYKHRSLTMIFLQSKTTIFSWKFINEYSGKSHFFKWAHK